MAGIERINALLHLTPPYWDDSMEDGDWQKPKGLTAKQWKKKKQGYKNKKKARRNKK